MTVSVKGFARGTKLTTEIVYGPLGQAKTVLDNAAIQLKRQAPFRVSWNMPVVSSRAFEYQPTIGYQQARLFLPFVMPPFQQDFTAAHQQPEGQVILTELSLAFDQRAEPDGIIDNYAFAHGNEGSLTATDMTRYTIILQLIGKNPTIFGGTETEWQNVFTATVPGDTSFGNPFYRQNPLLINELNIPIDPYKSYAWVIQIPGLFGDNVTVATCQAPNLTLQGLFYHPLVYRDMQNGFTPEVQNLPQHLGHKGTGNIPLTSPATNAVVDGQSDLQHSFGLFDKVLQDKLRSGYGSGSGADQALGQEQSPPVWEQIGPDSGYSVIAVPMWNTMEDARSSDYGAPFCKFPYQGGGDQTPTMDRRLVRIPTGFVLHHCVAVFNTTSYPAPVSVPGHVAWGDYPGLGFINTVGVAMCNGMRGDDYKYQQIAYLGFDSTNTANKIDSLKYDNLNRNYTLFNVPLVYEAGVSQSSHSYSTTGVPIFMGGGNSLTSVRTSIASGVNGTMQDPSTQGNEVHLEVRWGLQDSSNGLANIHGNPNSTIFGYGGHWVYLIGKQTITG